MSTPNTKRDQLIAKLKEMFQMDQADLDFGIYRIMNAKRDEVERFLDKDLIELASARVAVALVREVRVLLEISVPHRRKRWAGRRTC